MVIKLLFQEYLEHHYFIGSTPATIQWHKRCMNVFFREFPDIIDIDEISPELAQRYVYQLHKRGNKPVTIATTLRGIRAFFNWLKKRKKIVLHNPFEDLEVPKGYDAPPKFMFETEVQDMFQRLRKSSDFSSEFAKRRAVLILSLAYGLGLRLSEIQRLSLSDIDFSENMVKIERQKNKRTTYLPIGKRLYWDLKEYIKWREVENIHCEALIASVYNRNFYRHGYYKLTSFIREKIYPGFKGYHSLRHSNATALLRKGVPKSQVSNLLRHSSERVTDIYAKLVPEDLRGSVEILRY